MSDIAGIGVLILCCVMAWCMYQIFRVWKHQNDTDAMYETAHQSALRKLLVKKGIDLDKEEMKHSVFKKLQKKRSVRKRLEYETYKELFGDDKDIPE